MQKFTKFIMFFLFVGLVISSCQKDFNQYGKISLSKWNPVVAAPFVKTTITFRNIIGNDSNIITKSDSSLVYVYHQDSVISISSDSLMRVSPQLSQNYTFSLGAIHFDDFSDSTAISINDILPYFSGPTGDSLRKYDGKQNIFPPFRILSDFTVNMPELNNFNSLKFSKGTLDIVATNTLSVKIDTIAYDLVDISNNHVLKSIQILNLLPGASHKETIDMAGQTLGNRLKVIAHTFSSRGSNPDNVLIELNKGINFRFHAYDMTVISGTAKISKQFVFAEKKMLNISTSHSERFYEIALEKGTLNYTVHSNLNIGFDASLTLPSAIKNNEIPEQSFSVTPNGNINKTWDLSQTSFDLTTDSLVKYNRFPVDFKVTLNTTNQLITFDSSNKINTTFDIKGIALASVNGYLGKQKHQIDSNSFSLDLDFLKNLNGSLVFTTPEMILNYRNDFGIPIKVKMNFAATKTATGETQKLNFDSVTFKYPIVEGQTVYGSVDINKDNSSIVKFLSLRPDSINYSGGFITNPTGKTTNFLTNKDVFTANVDLKVPLNFKANGLVFTDTVNNVRISSEDIPAKSGTLVANVSNGFPFDVDLKLNFPDSITGETLRTLDFGTIKSAEVNSSGKENTPTNNNIRVTIPDGFFNDIQKANSMIVYLTVTSYNQGTVPVQVYSDDKVSISLGFEAKLNP